MKSMSKRFCLLYVFYCFVLFFCFQNNAYAEDKRILILHSYHPGLSWTRSIVRGIESTFESAKEDGYHFKIDIEYMDTKRFVGKSFYRALYNTYKIKAKKIKYDVIISADDNALNFLLKYRNELFGEVPVVFCGVNFYTESLLKGHKMYTGVVEAFDVKATLDIALKLHPETKEFVFIGDNSTSAISNRKAVLRVAQEYEKKGIQFNFLNDAEIMRYARDLGNLKKGSIIVAMLFNRDSDGKFYTYEESFALYSRYAKVPIYTFWEFYMNQGALGGKIISGVSQGEEAAKRAL